MKKLTFLTLLLCLVSTSLLNAQTQRTDYKKFDYLRVDEDQLQSFVNLIQNELMASYQKLVDSGDLKGWSLYQVKYPGGEKSSYNFISIATASDLSVFENKFSEIASPKYIPSSANTGQLPKLKDLTTLVKSELWKVENMIAVDSAAKPSQYITMDYMSVVPGKNPDYLMLEDEVAKPIHEERINVDRMAGWEVYSLISPGGVEYGYNFATGNYFEKLEHVEFGFTNEVINQAMGSDVDIPELFSTIYDTRDLVKIELWKLVANTQ